MVLYLYGLDWWNLNFYLSILEHHFVQWIGTLIELSGLQVAALLFLDQSGNVLFTYQKIQNESLN